MRSTFAEINLSNLRYNYLLIRRKTKRKVMVVVKANAYGHGVIPVVEALNKLGLKRPEYYGVALTEEAIEIRQKSKIDQPILTFSPFCKDEINEYYKYGILPSICSKREIRNLNSLKLRKKLYVQINVDTGMGRLGLQFDEAENLIKKISLNKNIVIDGIYTHFATSDEFDKTFANLQLKRFINLLNKLKSSRIHLGIVHAANSGAILDLPDSYFDMVRPGISLYGYFPSMETSESLDLKPVMYIKSKVSTIKKIRTKESVSYGRKFIANKDTKVATLPIGYADGISRGLSNKMKIIIKDKLYNQVGRVTMDRISVDIENANVKVGDNVIILGKSKKYKIDAWDWAKQLNTIPYEITCNISSRVPRVYR